MPDGDTASAHVQQPAITTSAVAQAPRYPSLGQIVHPRLAHLRAVARSEARAATWLGSLSGLLGLVAFGVLAHSLFAPPLARLDWILAMGYTMTGVGLAVSALRLLTSGRLFPNYYMEARRGLAERGDGLLYLEADAGRLLREVQQERRATDRSTRRALRGLAVTRAAECLPVPIVAAVHSARLDLTCSIGGRRYTSARHSYLFSSCLRQRAAGFRACYGFRQMLPTRLVRRLCF